MYVLKRKLDSTRKKRESNKEKNILKYFLTQKISI